ncbi:hypothetical protein V8E36_004484 [Tilletia maclaganii]
MRSLRVATLQLSPVHLGDVAANVEAVERVLAATCPAWSSSSTSLDLLVLPEMITTGYRFQDAHLVHSLCEPAASPSSSSTPSPSLRLGSEIANRLGAYVVIGFAERGDSNQAARPATAAAISTPFDARLDHSRRPVIPSANQGFYNSAALFDRTGALVHVFRKHFLYEDDKVWADEGVGFQYVDLPDLGRLCVGICMDLNPYEFKAEFTDFELASFCVEHEVDILAFPTAWLLSAPEPEEEGGEDKPSGPNSDPSKPSMSIIEYWASRCQPLYSHLPPNEHRSGKRKDTLFIAANRTGTERGVTFGGSSVIMHLSPPPSPEGSAVDGDQQQGSVRLLAAMGSGIEGYQETTVHLS